MSDEVSKADGASILRALNWRFATKEFDPAKRISPAELDVILDAIRLAPTSQGIQPFHVSVVESAAVRDEIAQVSYGQKQPSSASHLLVFSRVTSHQDRAERLFSHFSLHGMDDSRVKRLRSNYQLTNLMHRLTGQRKSWPTHQAYLALGVAITVAAQLGIDNCPMEGFRAGKVAKILGLPSHIKPVAFLALGYRRSDQESDNGASIAKYRLPREALIDFIR